VVTCYLDTSAAMKLVKLEQETKALREWIRSASGAFVSSGLLRIEMTRAALQSAPEKLPVVLDVLESVEMIPISPRVTDEALRVGLPSLRSLDAIHLATALSVQSDIDAMVTYDQRMAESARLHGLQVVAPGA
jgi:uncharacterized protein